MFKNDGLIKMPRLTNVQPEPVPPCIAMAEGGLTTARIARKQVSHTEIYHQISRRQISSDRQDRKDKDK